MHDAMTTWTGLAQRTSEQHVEHTSARRKRYVVDMTGVFSWISQYNPFDPGQPELRLVPSGLTVSDGSGINCNIVWETGHPIQKKLDNVNDLESSLRTGSEVRTLVELEKWVKIDSQNIHVDPKALFSRLVVLLERCEEMTSFFKFQLQEFPNENKNTCWNWHTLCFRWRCSPPSREVVA